MVQQQYSFSPENCSSILSEIDEVNTLKRTQALSGIKIVEWGSNISAPFCAKLLSDLGADVVKIEMPATGDESRYHGPFVDDIADAEQSGLFLLLNTNKSGITLNPEKPKGRDLLLELLKDADVFIQNQTPALITKLGLDFDSIKKVNPSLISADITPFGQTGPYSEWKAYDINICALGGITSASGSIDREPLVPPVSQGELQAGLIGAISIMMALFQRDKSGEGLKIDLAATDCWATFHIGIAIQAFLEEGRTRKRSGHCALHRPYPDEVLPCKDGFVVLDAPQNRQWRRLLEVMGNPRWADDPIFNDRIKTTDEHIAEADAYLSTWVMQHTKDEIFKLCQDNQVPAAPVKTVADVVDDPQFKMRGFFTEVGRSPTNTFTYPTAPYRFTETPVAIQRPAPRLGEHNEEIYCTRLGKSKAELCELKSVGII